MQRKTRQRLNSCRANLSVTKSLLLLLFNQTQKLCNTSAPCVDSLKSPAQPSELVLSPVRQKREYIYVYIHYIVLVVVFNFASRTRPPLHCRAHVYIRSGISGLASNCHCSMCLSLPSSAGTMGGGVCMCVCVFSHNRNRNLMLRSHCRRFSIGLCRPPGDPRM